MPQRKLSHLKNKPKERKRNTNTVKTNRIEKNNPRNRPKPYGQNQLNTDQNRNRNHSLIPENPLQKRGQILRYEAQTGNSLINLQMKKLKIEERNLYKFPAANDGKSNNSPKPVLNLESQETYQLLGPSTTNKFKQDIASIKTQKRNFDESTECQTWASDQDLSYLIHLEDKFFTSYNLEYNDPIFESIVDFIELPQQIKKSHRLCRQSWSRRRQVFFILLVSFHIKDRFYKKRENKILARALMILNLLHLNSTVTWCADQEQNHGIDVNQFFEKLMISVLWMAIKLEARQFYNHHQMKMLTEKLKISRYVDEMSLIIFENSVLQFVNYQIQYTTWYDIARLYLYRIFRNLEGSEAQRLASRNNECSNIQMCLTVNLQRTEEKNRTGVEDSNERIPQINNWNGSFVGNQSKNKSVSEDISKKAELSKRPQIYEQFKFKGLMDMTSLIVMYYLKLLYLNLGASSKDADLGAYACIYLAKRKISTLRLEEFKKLELPMEYIREYFLNEEREKSEQTKDIKINSTQFQNRELGNINSGKALF